MKEERYVVRDKDGDYWYPDGLTVGCTEVEFRDREDVELTRDEAYWTLRRVDEHYEPRVLKCKPGKPKPKAPREVFVVMRHGFPLGTYFDVETAVALAQNYKLSEDKAHVVRYVLAEGEK